MAAKQFNKNREVHGMSRTKTYRSWKAMRSRCLCPSNPAFYRYGGSGIGIDPRWNDFENFYADMGERPQGMSIDRMDNTKGYSPENCRWATRSQQSRNKRTNRLIEHDGKKLCVVEWAEIFGLLPHVILNRLQKGIQPPELFGPLKRHRRPPSTSSIASEKTALTGSEIAKR